MRRMRVAVREICLRRLSKRLARPEVLFLGSESGWF